MLNGSRYISATDGDNRYQFEEFDNTAGMGSSRDDRVWLAIGKNGNQISISAAAVEALGGPTRCRILWDSRNKAVAVVAAVDTIGSFSLVRNDGNDNKTVSGCMSAITFARANRLNAPYYRRWAAKVLDVGGRPAIVATLSGEPYMVGARA